MRFRRTRAAENAEWVESARLALGEVAGTVEDMLRPHARRELGPAVHRRLVADGLAKVRALIEHAPGVAVAAE